MKRLLLTIGFVAAALALAHGRADALCSGVPYTFSNGTAADATQVNANFSALVTCANSIDNTNISGALFASQIAPTTIAEATFGGSIDYRFPLGIDLGTPLSVANGGTGTTTPGLVAGTNVTITGDWPNQTVNATTPSGVVCYSASGSACGGSPHMVTVSGSFTPSAVACGDGDTCSIVGSAPSLSGNAAYANAYSCTGSATFNDGTSHSLWVSFSGATYWTSAGYGDVTTSHAINYAVECIGT